jgi:hypothetical protein
MRQIPSSYNEAAKLTAQVKAYLYENLYAAVQKRTFTRWAYFCLSITGNGRAAAYFF